MFPDFDPERYAREFRQDPCYDTGKTKFIGLEREDTFPLVLIHKDKEYWARYKINVYDYIIKDFSVYIFFWIESHSWDTTDPTPLYTLDFIELSNSAFDSQFADVEIPDGIDLMTKLLPPEITATCEGYYRMLKLLLASGVRKVHGEPWPGTLQVIARSESLGEETYNVYGMELVLYDESYIWGESNLRLTMVSNDRKIFISYYFNSKYTLVFKGNEYDTTPSGLRMLKDAFDTEQRLALI